MPVPPISFPPFGNPPFLIPPPNSNPPKGGKPQGALARRPLWRGWGNRGAPLPPRSRAPPPFGFPDPLRRLSPVAPRPPRGQAHWSGLHAVRALTTIPALQGVRRLTHVQRLRLSPLAPFAPRGGHVGFALLPASRGRAARKTRMGRSPFPLGRRACCPAAGGKLLAIVIINHILVVIGNPSVRRPTKFLASLETASVGRCQGGSAAVRIVFTSKISKVDCCVP